jgi:antitoxin (DNA-binding transcriptional repressor) of toxin-antitoxin stability system
MHQVDERDGARHFHIWLEAAARGETVVVLRDGQPIARIVPDSSARHEKAAQALEAIRALRRPGGRTPGQPA